MGFQPMRTRGILPPALNNTAWKPMRTRGILPPALGNTAWKPVERMGWKPMPRGDAMKEGFMKVAERLGVMQEAEGDSHGGAMGKDGSGLPTGERGNFMFATGIECSYPMTKDGRRDLLTECGHTDRYKEDLGLVVGLGLKCLRYGLPYHRISLGPDRYDWEWADLAMAEIKRLGLTPILDLLHFGLPDWLGDFQNPEFPARFAEYAEQVVLRYPWVRFWTPVNEIYVTAKFSGMDGIWNERLKTPEGFVTALKHCVAASILANHRIAKHRPDCIIVQSESAEYVHDLRPDPCKEIVLQNKLRFLALDLLYAHPPDSDVAFYALDAALTREEFDWFLRGEPPGYQIVGNDYYITNEKLRRPDGSMCGAQDVLGWYLITKEYYERYGKPVMHTETNFMDPNGAPQWLWKQWANVLRIRQDGVPVLGFTWYSLTDQIDWDIGLSEKRGTVNPCGLYDLDRKPRPAEKEFRSLLETFGQITIVPQGEVLELNDRPAALKVSV